MLVCTDSVANERGTQREQQYRRTRIEGGSALAKQHEHQRDHDQANADLSDDFPLLDARPGRWVGQALPCPDMRGRVCRSWQHVLCHKVVPSAIQAFIPFGVSTRH